LYQETYRENRADVDFYICGWSNMIDDAVENLILKSGYDKSQVHYELYG
jgi:ferredoxin-NADP reductase